MLNLVGFVGHEASVTLGFGAFRTGREARKPGRRKWLGFNDYQLDGTWSGGSKRVTFFNQKTERDLKNPTKKAKPTVFLAEVSVLRVFFLGFREF